MATSMIEKPRQRSWQAKRRGAIYCAPACGGGCTWQQFQAAKREARAICAALGPGWKPRVHENLGWWASATNEQAQGTVSFYGRPRRWRAEIFVGDHQIFGQGKSARAAWACATDKARTYADDIARQIGPWLNK